MTFRVELAGRATRFLRKADKHLYARVVKALEGLARDPFPSGVKWIAGQDGKVLRVRVGDYRILYEVCPEEKTVLVANIDKRPRAYR